VGMGVSERVITKGFKVESLKWRELHHSLTYNKDTKFCIKSQAFLKIFLNYFWGRGQGGIEVKKKICYLY